MSDNQPSTITGSDATDRLIAVYEELGRAHKEATARAIDLLGAYGREYQREYRPHVFREASDVVRGMDTDPSTWAAAEELLRMATECRTSSPDGRHVCALEPLHDGLHADKPLVVPNGSRMVWETPVVRTPCSDPNPCEDGGEPCARHEREESHADGEHELCGPECDDAEVTP